MQTTIFSDGKPGHLNQSLAVAAALGDTDPSIVEVSIAAPLLEGAARVLSATLPLGHDLLQRLISAGYETEGETRGEVFICCGTTTALSALAAGLEHDASVVGVMKPSLVPAGLFDLLIAPEHDRLEPAPNIITTPITPSRFDRESADFARERCLEFWGGESESEFWALALGGPAERYRPNFAIFERLLDDLEERARKNQRRLALTSSRRTPKAWEQRVRERAEERPSRWLEPVLVGELGEDSFNPLPFFFRDSEWLFMSEESVSMVSEAITAGRKPVLLRLDQQLRGKRALFVNNLLKQGLAYAVGDVDELELVFDHAGEDEAQIPDTPRWAEELCEKLTPTRS